MLSLALLMGLLGALRQADARVATIAWRLQTANVALCAKPVMLPGFSVETLEQYAPSKRAEARAELGLGELPQVGAVVPGSTAVHLTLEDGSDYGYAGTVQFSELTVNEATGTVTLRARLPNPQGLLLPGMFVQATFDQAMVRNAYLVPEPALQRDVDGDSFVFVVKPGNTIERRKVQAERMRGANWIVTAGLAPNEKIVTQGTNGLKNGMAVRAVPASAPERIGPRPDGARPANGS